ncbi:hypothetical protein ANN_02332 [Periplaneta americana]|uniref:Uncharacterized protein n=1 Tax=Periplaneta americana TaxID=6978 RepID=A0ABQ8TW30_PERAM|nr:hypothetical protein ANN_02332 [Periplaneta americana]
MTENRSKHVNKNYKRSGDSKDRNKPTECSSQYANNDLKRRFVLLAILCLNFSDSFQAMLKNSTDCKMVALIEDGNSQRYVAAVLGTRKAFQKIRQVNVKDQLKAQDCSSNIVLNDYVLLTIMLIGTWGSGDECASQMNRDLVYRWT